MRGIIATIAVLLVAGYLATCLELPASFPGGSPPEPHPQGWRRTVDGWEYVQAYSWRVPGESAPRRSPRFPIHPGTVAALQVLVSLFALAWHRQERRARFITPQRADVTRTSPRCRPCG